MSTVFSLSGHFDQLAARSPDAVALYCGERAIRFGELVAEAQRVAHGLARQGIGAGDAVAIWLPNVPAWLTCHLALARLGALTIATNTRYRSREIADVWARAGVKGAVFWPHYRNIEFGKLLHAARPGLPGLQFLVAYDGDPDAHGSEDLPDYGLPVLPYSTLADGAAAPLADRGADERPLITFTTSGTTGSPKLALHTHAGILRHALAVGPAFGYSAPDACVLHLLPFCGTYGYTQTMATLCAGRPLVMQHTFDPKAAGAQMRARRTTHGAVTMELMERLYVVPDAAALPFMRYYMGATGHALGAREAEGQFRIRGIYGSSEVQALHALQPDAAAWEDRIAGGGMPVSPELRVRARRVGAAPDEAPLPHGEWGELEFTGFAVMHGYLNNPEATARAFTPDGWYRSGDLGYTLADGSYRFVSRLGDAIRLGGFLVDPHEVEKFLQEYPGIDICQMVGVEREGKTTAVLFYTCKPGVPAVEEAALRRHCRENIASYKVPARFVPLESFPVVTSANNTKIVRAELRKMAERVLDGEALQA